MPEYMEVASGFIGAGVETLASRAAVELDKSQGWNANQPYMRVRTWVDWGLGLGTAVVLFWKGSAIKSKRPKLYEAIAGVGHAAVANAAPHIEEQVTGIRPYSPIPKYAQKTMTPPQTRPNTIQIKSLQQPGVMEIQAMTPPLRLS